MSFNVEVTSYFKKQAKSLVKKCPSLTIELEKAINSLVATPIQGTPLGNHCYKIRISIASKNKGKSGGGRLITHIQFSNNVVYMLSIYDKAVQKTITDTEIKELLKQIP